MLQFYDGVMDDLSSSVADAVAQGGEAGGDLASLLREVEPITPTTTVTTAADLIQLPQNAAMLCLPVVDGEGRLLGTLSRNQLTAIFLHRYGRELYGARPVTQVMNTEPVAVNIETPLEQAASIVSAGIGSPISEDFAILSDGRYLGMGVVIDLLGAMQARVRQSAVKLSKAYTQLQSSQTALVQSEKMASLGQMVAGVAHEINTPLGYVRNNVEMTKEVFIQLQSVFQQHESLAKLLVDEHADEAALNALLSQVTAATAELKDSQLLEDTLALFEDTLFGVSTISELVVNLRNFSRLDGARLDRVNLNECLDQTLVIASPVLKNKVEVIKRYGELPAVQCAPSQINQVLLNLLSNGAQAIEHGEGKLLLKTEADSEWVRVSIQDNGKGIPPENLGKIFDPFFTTKPVGQGTGLGLSISHQIVQAHGGRLQVASVVGKGTRFLLSLPRVTPEARPVTPVIADVPSVTT
jgi:signal transduction histidine kinase